MEEGPHDGPELGPTPTPVSRHDLRTRHHRTGPQSRDRTRRHCYWLVCSHSEQARGMDHLRRGAPARLKGRLRTPKRQSVTRNVATPIGRGGGRAGSTRCLSGRRVQRFADEPRGVRAEPQALWWLTRLVAQVPARGIRLEWPAGTPCGESRLLARCYGCVELEPSAVPGTVFALAARICPPAAR